MASRAWDLLDRRILAGIRFVDMFKRPVRSPVAIAAGPGVRWFVKPNNVVVLTNAPGLEAYAASFSLPAGAPALGSIEVPLDLKPADASYAPRRVTIALPREPGGPNDLFAPIDVTLHPTQVARCDGLNAGVRVVVRRTDDGRVVENALVRLQPKGLDRTFALTDAGGEALLLASGVPLTTPGPGAVMLGDIAAAVDAIVQPDAARFHTPAQVFAARLAAHARSRGFVDPDAINGSPTPPVALRLAAGRIGNATIEWTPP